MRKATIWATAAIGVIALVAAIGVTQREPIMNWLTQSAEVYGDRGASKEDTPPIETTQAEAPAPAPATTFTEEEIAAKAQEIEEVAKEIASVTPRPIAPPAPVQKASTDESGDGADTFTVDVAAALKDREIGSPDAPVVIEDFSSMTCPHCAKFHNEIYPKIKEDYIDTGKVRWIYRGFPLNDAALRAEMLARCAPEDQYVKIVNLLFSNQTRWAFVQDPIANLSVLLRVAGFTDEMFLTCANNKELMDGLLKATQSWGKKYNINATPTFILNGEKALTGAGTHEGFVYDLERMLRQSMEVKQTPMPQ